MMYRSRLGNDLSDDITLDYVSSINDDSEIILFDILRKSSTRFDVTRK